MLIFDEKKGFLFDLISSFSSLILSMFITDNVILTEIIGRENLL